MGYCVGGKWIEVRCNDCGKTIKIYTTDALWEVIKRYKTNKCEKCGGSSHNIN